MIISVSEMPPLHTAEGLAGVQQTANPSQPPPAQGVGSGGVSGSSGGVIDSSQTSDVDSGPTQTQSSSTATNNTISAAADSSDNQPPTPQPHLGTGGDPQQPPTTLQSHHPYANHHIYAAQQPTTTSASSSHINQMYAHNIYSSTNIDMQQQQNQQPITPAQPAPYPSYLNSYEQFYQQQQQQHSSQNPQMDYVNSNSGIYSSSSTGVRYHPYLHTPTPGLNTSSAQNANPNNTLDAVNSQTSTAVSSASSSVMSPRVVSSTSPSSSSNQMQMSGSASSIGSMSAGNPSSPANGGTPQCKKCGIMCTNDSELQEHIANVHGASPYASSGYASSPYIKEDLQQQTPPSQTPQQQQQQPPQQPAQAGGNPGEILDLDSQKMLYPPGQAAISGMMHPSVGGVNDPLQSMHSMQQRAGMASWDQQSAEGLPPYMQNNNDTKNISKHSPYYQSPQQSPYQVSNSTSVIKSEYSIIKSDYPSDTQQYIGDKSFDPTAPVSQQMMPPAVSSSPAEFPSTTTGGPQDSQQTGNQQFRAGNFEPPTSSSALSTNMGTKAANWKSNEARRPKTYNCTACNKWFTSSGHLKRHYNTTLHKNAVKSSGQPDPATLPISAHHHPAREGTTGKASRRGAAASAAAAANVAAQQQQQPPNPVQPPEPPNSPQDYGGPQAAAGGLTSMSHYAATPSPNSMYQQQQYSHNQYMPQVQSATNASSQCASIMSGAQQSGTHNQQTVMNGHPNALAGPFVPTIQQQMPTMPSSQMRGLLNTTIMLIAKNEHMEAAMEDPELQARGPEEVEQQQATEAYVKEEFQYNTHSATAVELGQILQLEAPAHSAALPHMELQPQLHFQLEPQQADMGYLYHNTIPSSTHNSIQVLSPLIISHQQYQEQLQLEQQQIVGQVTYTLTQTPPPLQQQHHHNIVEPQHCINMPLAINTQQHNSMLQLQQPPITMEQQQLQPDITIHTTTSMVSMLRPNHLMQHTELQPLVSTQLQQQQPLDTISTSTLHTPPSHTITNSIPSFRHLHHQVSGLQPLDPMLTYPHIIIGNSSGDQLPPINTLSDAAAMAFEAMCGDELPPTDTLSAAVAVSIEVSSGDKLPPIGPAVGRTSLDAFGNVKNQAPDQVQQTTEGNLHHLITVNSPKEATTPYTEKCKLYTVQGSPQEGDLPPISDHYTQEPTTSSAVVPPTANSPPSSDPSHAIMENSVEPQHAMIQEIKQEPETQSGQQAKPTTTAAPKRKRNPSTSSSIGPNSTLLPNGRIKCLPCNKEFTKICYLTQHNKSFHSGEYPFRCQKCGKRYQCEDIYKTHLDKHKTTDKAHKCELCPKQFHHKTDLRRHIEAIHTGKKQHSCDICEKSFCRKDHLRKHIETHNRPRVAAKRTKAAANRGKVTAFTKVENKINILKPLEDSHISSTPSPPADVQSPLSSIKFPIRQTADTNGSDPTPPPVMQQTNNFAADDDELLGKELGDYGPQEVIPISIQQCGQNVEEQQHHYQQHQYILHQHLVNGELAKQTYQNKQNIPRY